MAPTLFLLTLSPTTQNVSHHPVRICGENPGLNPAESTTLTFEIVLDKVKQIGSRRKKNPPPKKNERTKVPAVPTLWCPPSSTTRSGKPWCGPTWSRTRASARRCATFAAPTCPWIMSMRCTSQRRWWKTACRAWSRGSLRVFFFYLFEFFWAHSVMQFWSKLHDRMGSKKSSKVESWSSSRFWDMSRKQNLFSGRKKEFFREFRGRKAIFYFYGKKTSL